METYSPWNPELNLSELYTVACNIHGVIAKGVTLITAFNTKTDHYRNFACHPTEIDIVEGSPLWEPKTQKVDEELYRNQYDTG